ncbi:thiol-disulfide oxidoreductase DCC family protein [Paraferrimonas sedimenticola]|uniref:Cell division protein n=1 Tax=Paraferrimonas sedimenticola TaxID=375674 RepID=A0AA37RY94_9GAMM|nr:DUF393 domain-containing protein [Paraferrimonas sedimenticola]GLP96977.1 cell division protein [Paraferrimonas sedimenticola]
MAFNTLTIFYDGECPLCCMEMDKLKTLDAKGRIDLVDLHTAGFEFHCLGIEKATAMRMLHGLYKGEVLTALDVTHKAWQLVGRGFWVAPLQWPVVKQVAHGVYLGFAKYRHPISNFFHKRFGIGKPHCEDGVCYRKL